MKGRIVIATVAVLSLIAAIGAWQGRDVVCIDGITPPWIDDTVYAPQYSHRAFCELDVGTSIDAIQEILGPPLGISWVYGAFGDLSAPWIEFADANGEWRVKAMRGSASDLAGQLMSEVRASVGDPRVELWATAIVAPRMDTIGFVCLTWRTARLSRRSASTM